MATAEYAERPVPVLYLDIDGTVRHGRDELGHFVNRAADVTVFWEAVVMMRRWKAGGGRITGVSNQGGIALGLVTMDDVMAAMVETQRQCDGLFDLLSWCSLVDRFPGEIYPPYMGFMVGDRLEDEECAQSAGLDFEWASDWRAKAHSK